METKDLSQFAHEEFCYLTTTGRKTGNPHEIEIWFCIHDNSIYLMAGGGETADWVQNLIQNPVATIRIAKEFFTVTARFDKDKAEDESVRNLMADKYHSSIFGESFPMIANMLYWLWFINFNLGIFNALPIGPLDGGQLYNSLIESRSKLEKTKVKNITSTITSVMVLIVLMSIFLPYLPF